MSGSSFRSHCGEIGRHEGLKIPFWRQSAGSSPAGGMERSKLYGKTYDFWAFFFLRMDGQKINRKGFFEEKEASLSMKKRVFRPDSSRIITIKEAFERFQIKLIKADETACGDIGGVSDIPRRRAVGGTLYPRTGNTLASDNGRKCNMDVSPKERCEQDVNSSRLL